MQTKFWVAGFVMALAAPLAMAVEGSYFYGAVDVGHGKMSNFCAGASAGASCKDTDSDYRLSAGYQVISGVGNEGFGIEGSYVNAGKSSFSVPGVAAAETKDSEWQLAVVGTLPWADRLTAVSKIGVTFWSLKTTSTSATPVAGNLSSNGTDFIFGLGAQFEVSKPFAIRAMYDTHMTGEGGTRSHLSTMSLGAIYRF